MKHTKRLIIIMALAGTAGFFVSTKKIISQNKKEEIMEKKQRGLDSEKAPQIDIDEKARKISTDILNGVLADEFVLLVQTLNYHWNLVGPQFNDYHKLFDDQYHAIFDFIDEIAERVRSVGGIAVGNMKEMIQQAHLEEDTGDIPAPKDMVKNLLAQHESLIRVLRKGINETAIDDRDMGTNNHLTDLLGKHEKMAWMLRALTERN